MKKIPTDAELEAEVDYFVKNIDEISARQQQERVKYARACGCTLSITLIPK